MGKRGGKKNPSKSKSNDGKKVGIVCHSLKEERAEDDELKLYMVDVDQIPFEEYETVTPAVKFILPGRSIPPALCVLESTLYLFAGHNHLTRFRPKSEIPEKYAKKLELSEEEGDYEVKVAQLAGVSDMNYSKFYPVAIPTPDRKKILVLGTNILVEESSHAFELYDPKWNEWETIPALPLKCRCPYGGFRKRPPCDCNYWIKSYGFGGKCQSHFLVEMQVGMFALNLKTRKWSKVCVPSIPGGGGYFLTVYDQYVLTPTRAYNLRDGKGFLLEEGIAGDSDFIHGPPIPLSTFAPSKRPKQYTSPSIVPIHPFADGGGVYNTCVLQFEKGEQEHEAHILIDVCHTDVTTLETTVSKRVSLGIKFYDYLTGLHLISL